MRIGIAAVIALAACGGQQGPAGTTALSARTCTGIVKMNYISLSLSYQIVDYAGGDKLIICEVMDDRGSHSTERFCLAADATCRAAFCFVTHSVDATPYGGFSFRSDAPGERAIYNATGSPYDGTVSPLPCH